MDTFEFIFFIVIWERILRCVNAVSRELQSPRIDLSVASRLLNIAFSELKYLRESWQSVMLTASALAKSWDGSLEFQQKRGRKARCKSGVLVVDGILMDPEQSFKINVLYKTVDTALMQLTERFKDQAMVTSLFSCIYPNNLAKLNPDMLENAAQAIRVKYPNDLTDELDPEMRSFATEFRKEISVTDTVLEVNNLMLQSRISSSFPEMYKLLILFITLPLTVASAERSFSKLKLIKTYLRSTMSQERLDDLAILSIENKEANKIDKTKLIRDFANIYARRKAHVVSKST